MNNGVERKKITQEDCDIARFFTRRGMKMKEIGKILGVDASTISKMKAGDFRLDQYLKIRKESNKKQTEKKTAVIDLTPIETMPSVKQLAGQMEMDLKPAKAAAETPEMNDQTKMMRFQAHLADRIIKKMDEILKEMGNLFGDGGAEK